MEEYVEELRRQADTGSEPRPTPQGEVPDTWTEDIKPRRPGER